MAYETGDLRELFREAEAEFIRREDARDFNAEMAGLDIGKMARFLSAEQREERGHKNSGQTRRAESLSRLQILLASNPAYAKLYNDTFDGLRDAESKADDALAKLEAAHEQARKELHDMLDHAARLPDGTRVFKDKNAQVWDEHGARISDADAATIHWRGDEPTQEAYADQRDYTEKLERGIDEMRGIQVDLGGIHEEMADQENPPAEERIEELGGRIQELDHRTQDVLSRIRPEPGPVANPEAARTVMLPLPPG